MIWLLSYCVESKYISKTLPYDELEHRQWTHSQPLTGKPFVKRKDTLLSHYLLSTIKHTFELRLTFLISHQSSPYQVYRRCSTCYSKACIKRAKSMKEKSFIQPAVSEDFVLQIVILRQLHCSQNTGSHHGWLDSSVKSKESTLPVYLLSMPSESFRRTSIRLHSNFKEVAWICE